MKRLVRSAAVIAVMAGLVACAASPGERSPEEAREFAEAPTGSNILRKGRNNPNVKTIDKDSMQDAANQGDFTALPQVRK